MLPPKQTRCSNGSVVFMHFLPHVGLHVSLSLTHCPAYLWPLFSCYCNFSLAVLYCQIMKCGKVQLLPTGGWRHRPKCAVQTNNHERVWILCMFFLIVWKWMCPFVHSSTENTFCSGDHVSWHSPLDNSESRIQHMLLTEDPQMQPIQTPFGTVSFLQVSELFHIKHVLDVL